MDTKEIIFDLMDDYTKGVDTYSHNGSTWLIFTDSKKWVIELTKEKTLWYNYYFFTGVFKYLSLDVVENQHYITKWVEDTIINPVKHTSHFHWNNDSSVKDTIENGVKDTRKQKVPSIQIIEDTIQNGVKSTYPNAKTLRKRIKDTIQNGVKHTEIGWHQYNNVEYAIQNGVKETISTKHPFGGRVEDTIQNGVKKTYSDKIPHEYDWTDQFTEEIDDVIKNGVIDTIGDRASYRTKVESIIQHSIKETKSVSNNLVDALRHGGPTTYADDYTQDFWVDVVVEKGIKETKDALSNRLPNPIENVLENGIKKTKPMDDWVNSERIIENTIKNGIKNTKSEVATREWKASEVINNGIKETNPHFLEIINPMNFESNILEMKRLNEVNDTIQNGVKEVKELPDQSGELKGYGNYYHVQEDRTKPHTEYVNDVIRDGIKETVTGSDKRMLVENVLNNGVKLT